MYMYLFSCLDSSEASAGAMLQFTKDINTDKTSALALMSGQCSVKQCSAW